MTQALTLTEAAERLAPSFVEESGTLLPAAAKPSKGRWLSLDDAASVLSQRVTGQEPAPKKLKAETTVKQAAVQIERPYADLTEIRRARAGKSTVTNSKFAELNNFVQRAVQHFQGYDDSVVNSPDYQQVYAYAMQLRADYLTAYMDELETWDMQCRAENEAFENLRPDWSQADAMRVLDFLTRLGASRQEVDILWRLPEPINIASPICLAISKMTTGTDGQDAIPAALAAVGFGREEIQAVMSGQAPIFLRDHRIQELVARAVDAHTPTENREAA